MRDSPAVTFYTRARYGRVPGALSLIVPSCHAVTAADSRTGPPVRVCKERGQAAPPLARNDPARRRPQYPTSFDDRGGVGQGETVDPSADRPH